MITNWRLSMDKSLNKTIESHLSILKLKGISNVYESMSESASKSKLSYLEYLSLLLETAVNQKKSNSTQRRISQAKFPMLKTVESFDFSFQPGLNEKEVLQLNSLSFLDQKNNVIFLGPPGVGKTHLAIALGIQACSLGHRVEFKSCKSLISELALAEKNGDLMNKLIHFSRIHLLIIDEMGYMPISNHEANLLFQLVSMLYEKVSIILTSNFNFDAWNRFFQDSVVAAAIIDRLVHHAHLFFINGSSYRVKEKLKISS